MPEDSKTVACGNCGLLLHEDLGQPAENRPPCPACGSTTRAIHVTVYDTASFSEKLGVKGRHAGGGKPFMEQIHGADLHRKTGKLMHLSRIIDRENDLYHEVVTDPITGEVVHECKEPLSHHVGHGIAKQKRKKTNESAE